MFKNMKLTTKIMSALTTIIIGMLIIAVTAYNGLHKIGEEIVEIAEYETPLLITIVEIEKDILEAEILTLELILASKDVKSKEFKELEEKILELEKETTKNILLCIEQANKAANHAHIASLKKQYIEIGDACKLFEKEQKVFEKNLAQLEDDLKSGHLENVDEEKKLILSELKQMDKQAIELVHKMEKLSEALANQAKKDEEAILLIVEITSIIFLILAIIIAIALNKDIKRNINTFQVGLLSFFKYLNRETSDIQLLDDTSKDEIGTMAKVVNENINKTKKGIEEDKKVVDDTILVLSEFEQGDLTQRVKSHTTNPALKELTSLLNQMGENIEANIEKALDILEQYSHNNYINRVETNNIKEHLLKLANGVNIVGDSTTRLLADNLEKGLTLQSKATILNENVTRLSTSSNQQAASLEETSAALEEITSTIVSNAGNVTKMSALTNDLSSAVSSGEKLANDTSSSMNMIDEKVSSITEAITIIDQIAFQTNILSLNAAVEAATAGEAGKGFAVVAQEVRNLATRSAEAAKDIKELVESATQKANEGKDNSTKMIEGYNELNKIILTTVELINEVSTASSEQRKGIEQINDAISHLDKATQENARTASQTNEIAKDTNNMSQEIVEEANKSEFSGKNSIKAIKSETRNIEPTTVNTNKPTQVDNTRKKEQEVKQVVVANNDNDEWESF